MQKEYGKVRFYYKEVNYSASMNIVLGDLVLFYRRDLIFLSPKNNKGDCFCLITS